MVQDENGKEVPIVDRQGRFVTQMGEFGGRWVKELLRPTTSRPTRLQNPRRRADCHPHERATARPSKWRSTSTPTRTAGAPTSPCSTTRSTSWFIRTTAVKDRLIELNKTINWQPESTGTGRFGNWLENLVDWNLSRSRYWGTPLPIWRTEDGRGNLHRLYRSNWCSIRSGQRQSAGPATLAGRSMATRKCAKRTTPS